MTSTPDTDPFLDAMRQGQEAALNALESWTKAVQQTFGQAAGATPTTGTFDPNQFVDQYFNFAEAVLRLQRQFAKTLMGASRQAVEAAQPGGGEGG
jgi:hypothetical protein